MIRLMMLFGLMLLAGCVTTNPFGVRPEPQKDVWTFAEASRLYGKPDLTDAHKDGSLQAIWFFTRTVVKEIEIYDPATSTYKPAGPVEQREVIRMEFDSKGILRDWSAKSKEDRFP